MEFFDASTLPESARQWEPLVPPLTVPRPSKPLIGLSLALLMFSLLVATRLAIDWYIARAFWLPVLVAIVSLLTICICQVATLTLRSWIWAIPPFILTVPMLGFGITASTLCLKYEAASFVIGLTGLAGTISLVMFWLLQYDWILRLRKAHKDGARYRASLRFSLLYLWVVLLFVCLLAGFASFYSNLAFNPPPPVW